MCEYDVVLFDIFDPIINEQHRGQSQMLDPNANFLQQQYSVSHTTQVISKLFSLAMA